MSNRTTASTFSLLGGALVGATAMYLMDPDSGRRRREAVRQGATDALHRAEALAEEGWEHVADTAREFGGRARDAAGRATELGGAAVDTARSRLSDWAAQAQDAGERTAARARA